MAKSKKKWSDLTGFEKRMICVAGAAEALMTAAAVRDLARRPGREIRGPKAVWALALFVQPVGPLAYFAVARR